MDKNEELDMNIVLKKLEPILNNIVGKFPPYMRDDLKQEARIKFWSKLSLVINNWERLRVHQRIFNRYIKSIIENAMKNTMRKEIFVVSLKECSNVAIPYKIPINIIPVNLYYCIAINYVKKQIVNGFSVSPSIIKQLAPKSFIEIICDLASIEAKKSLLFK